MTDDVLKQLIRAVPDFPEPGILFRDITPLLLDPGALQSAIEALAGPFAEDRVGAVAAMEARGFILGSLVARTLQVGFVPLRKPGKLPRAVHRAEYELEYGDASLEMHTDALAPATRVLVVDDLIATGGTARASCRLVEAAGARVVGCAFLIELTTLGGRAALSPRSVHSVLRYE